MKNGWCFFGEFGILPRIYSEQQDLNTAVLSKLRTTAVLSRELSSLRVFLVCRSNCFTSASSPFRVAAVVSAAVMAAVFSEIALLREVSNSEQAWKHSELRFVWSFDTQSLKRDLQDPTTSISNLSFSPAWSSSTPLDPWFAHPWIASRDLAGSTLHQQIGRRSPSCCTQHPPSHPLDNCNFRHMCPFKTTRSKQLSSSPNACYYSMPFKKSSNPKAETVPAVPLQAMAPVTKPRFEPSFAFGQSPRLLPNPNSSASDPAASRRPATSQVGEILHPDIGRKSVEICACGPFWSHIKVPSPKKMNQPPSIPHSLSIFSINLT